MILKLAANPQFIFTDNDESPRLFDKDFGRQKTS